VAKEYDITIDQGATFKLDLVWRDSAGDPIDLTDYSARMQVRQSVRSDTTELNLVSPADIALGGLAGTIAVTASATDTAAMTIKRGVYDLEVVSASGVVTRLLQGAVEVSKEVTR
jgi:hypothetical protein